LSRRRCRRGRRLWPAASTRCSSFGIQSSSLINALHSNNLKLKALRKIFEVNNNCEESDAIGLLCEKLSHCSFNSFSLFRLKKSRFCFCEIA
jgi:hypothetical protein